MSALPIALPAPASSSPGWELFRPMLDVASGRKKTWAEQWKLHNAPVLSTRRP